MYRHFYEYAPKVKVRSPALSVHWLVHPKLFGSLRAIYIFLVFVACRLTKKKMLKKVEASKSRRRSQLRVFREL